MAAFLGFDEFKKVFLIQFSGVLTDELITDGYQRMRAWLAQHGPCDNISDFSDVTSLQISSKVISQMAANSPLVPASFTRVIVAPQDDVFGMARMFEGLGSSAGNRVDIVRSRAEAYQLAGVEDPKFDPIEL